MNTSWVSELVGINFLALADVVLDVHQEFQLTGDRVTIPLYQQVVKFHELLPGNTSGLIDRACELRWKSVNLLARHGVVSGVELNEGDHRWGSTITLEVHQRRLRSTVHAVESEAARRATEHAADGVAAPTAAELARLRLPEQVTPAWLWSNVSVKTWLAGVGILVTVFMLGIGAGEIYLVRQLLRLNQLPGSEASPRPLSVISRDLFVDVGGRGASLNASLRVAAEQGPISLSRTVDVVTADVDYEYFHGAKIKPRIMSVTPERAVLAQGEETDVHIQFDPVSLVAKYDSVRHLSQGAIRPAGYVILKFHYYISGQERTVNVEMPVFIRV